MKMNKYVGMAMMAASVLAVASCTDYDDYNKVVADDTMPSANQTLWQTIQQNEQLTDFAALVEKAGFAEELNTPQYYTVWAPLNGTFDRSQYEALPSKDLLKQFVKNHIASYAHHASGQLNEDDRILMLNEKSFVFAGTQAAYTFGDIKVATANIPGSNGLLHTLDGAAKFYPNLYEYVIDSTLAVGKEIDNLRRFFLKYDTLYLDRNASVAGPMVDGRQTYLDSVMVHNNTLWSELRASIQKEDSSYTFVMPTNDCWEQTYDRIRPYFNYVNPTRARVYTKSTSTDDYEEPETKLSVSAKALGDSLANYYLTSNLIFSNTSPYNAWVEGEVSPVYGSDTLYSTTRTKLSTGQDIINLAKERVVFSNGFAYLTDTLAFLPWETYAPEVKASMTQSTYPVIYTEGRNRTVTVRNPSPDIVDLSETKDPSTYRYLWMEAMDDQRPTLTAYLPNVLSTTYNIYCIFVPEKVDTAKADIETKPNRVMFVLNYCDEKGEIQEKAFLDEREENYNAFKEKYGLSDTQSSTSYTSNYNANRAFSNDTSKVDTLFVGEFTFPVSYAGLSAENPVCPSITVLSPLSMVGSSRQKVYEDYTRDLRIAGFILKPKELVEFEETKMK